MGIGGTPFCGPSPSKDFILFAVRGDKRWILTNWTFLMGACEGFTSADAIACAESCSTYSGYWDDDFIAAVTHPEGYEAFTTPTDKLLDVSVGSNAQCAQFLHPGPIVTQTNKPSQYACDPVHGYSVATVKEEERKTAKQGLAKMFLAIATLWNDLVEFTKLIPILGDLVDWMPAASECLAQKNCLSA